MQYNLCDIHLHTNLSYDAYEHSSKKALKYNIDDIVDNYINKSENAEEHVKLLCMTDHNVFIYNEYKKQKMLFDAKGIYLLPGIEVNANGKIHWIIIFNDLLLEKNENWKTVESIIKDTFNYNDIDDIIIQARKNRNKQINIENFMKRLLNSKVDFLAIPHMDKTNGWFEVLKDYPEQTKLLNYFVCDGIINGFESKKMENSILEKINATTAHLLDYYNDLEILIQEIKELDNIDDNSERYFQVKELIEQKNKEIAQREKYLKIVEELQEIIDENDVPCIYGSDFHGRVENQKIVPYNKDKLFYIKSECTFEGLKFSLIDCYSRIFSIDRYLKYKKSNNFIIKEIDLEINGKPKKISLGDGLNSIIGSRGTGKSFLLSKLLGYFGYENTVIDRQIKLNSIEFLNHHSQQQLYDFNVTYIGQKSNKKMKDELNKNIYDLLADAPYDYKKFEESLREIYKGNNKKVFNNEINIFLDRCNQLIDNYIYLNNEQNKKYDLSYIDSYNEFYGQINEDNLIYTLFDKVKSKISNEEEDIINKISRINQMSNNVNNLLEDVLWIQKFDDLKQLFIGSKICENDGELLKELYKLISINIKNYLEPSRLIIENTKIHTNKILNVFSKNSSNSQIILASNIDELENYIKSLSNLLRRIHYDEQYVSNELSKEKINKEKYSFESSSSKLELLICKKISLNNLSENEANQLFSNYKSFTMDSTILSKLFKNNSFGENYITDILKYKDLRRTSVHLELPNIQAEVLVKKNDEEYIKWDEQSPGQRADTILSFVLEGNTNKILIIDQPEDDLDNETIFNKIVKMIRTIKLYRQIIIVTHNANLAITGDSDRLIICQNDNNKFDMICDSMESTRKYNYKSLNSDIKDETVLKIGCKILEGGTKALKQRVNKIGYRQLFFEGD